MSSKPQGKNDVQKPATRTSAQVGATALPAAMTGRAGPATTAVGDRPVFAYIAKLPQPQRGIAEAVDVLAANTLPDLVRGRRSRVDGQTVLGVSHRPARTSGH